MADVIEIVTDTPTVVEVGTVGPQGPAGATGATGPQGPQGTPGTGVEILTTKGDLLYQDTSAAARLPIGSSGQILKVSVSGVPEWGAAPSSGVSSVSGTAPIVSSGGATPAISITAATTSAAGSMSAADKLKLDGIAASSANPQPLGVAAAGTSGDFSRADHVHAMPSAEDVGAAPSTITSNAADTSLALYDQPAGQNALSISDDIVVIAATAVSSFRDALELGTASTADIGTGAGDVCAGDDARLSDSRSPTAHASSHQAGEADELFDQNLSTTDTPTFTGLTIEGTAVAGQTPDTVLRGGAWFGAGDSSSGVAVYKDGSSSALKFEGVNEAVTQYVPLQFSSNGQPQLYLATGGNVGIGTSSPIAALDVAGNAVLRDVTNDFKATFDADDKLSADRTYDLPDASGTLALTSDIPALGTGAGEAAEGNHVHGNLTSDGKLGSTAGLPVVTTTAGAVTTLALGTANQVLRVNSGATGVEFADPAASGVTGAAASASDVLGVSGANITGVDATADRIVFWDDSASALKYLEAGSGLSISGTTLTATASGGSKTYAVFTATDNQPPASNYATLDTRNSIAVLDFDAASDENAVFVGVMPESAVLTSGLTVYLHWMATSATSGNVRWGAQIERSNTDLDSDSFDTAAEANGAANGTSGIVTVTSITLTNIDSVTAGDLFRLKVYRNADDATNDTMTGDAELVAVELRSAA